MLSVKQSVIVQDCSHTRNNNEFKRDSVRDANSKNRPKGELLTQDFARNRPVSQTASSFKAIKDRFDKFWAILVSKQRIKHIEQQASDFQARLKTMNKGKSNLAHEQSSDLVRANP